MSTDKNIELKTLTYRSLIGEFSTDGNRKKMSAVDTGIEKRREQSRCSSLLHKSEKPNKLTQVTQSVKTELSTEVTSKNAVKEGTLTASANVNKARSR